MNNKMRILWSLIFGMACCCFSGCLSYGRYHWGAYPVDGGYVVDCMVRGDREHLDAKRWQAEMEERALTLVSAGLRSKGFDVKESEVLIFSVNQGDLVLISIVEGDRRLLVQARDVGRIFHKAIGEQKPVAQATGKFPLP